MGSSPQNTCTSTEIERKLSNSYNADHPFTKTILNTIRNESKERLYRFMKTDPYFLDRHFQLFDVPDILTGCPTDRLSIFRTKSVLYFDPLCIAIYFRKSNLIKYILDLGGNVNHENYATGIFCRKSNTQDFIQFPPLCVVIRREFIDGLITFMEHFSFKLEDTRISTFYLNSEIERVITYDDILSYTLAVLKIRNNYPLKRLVHVLLRHEIQVRQIDVNSKELGEMTGLFLLKLTRATISDSKLRVVATLITALEQVVKSVINGKNYPRKDVKLATLKEDFCSDISTHYNFTGLVCLHILYQRCLEWGRIGFDHMIISLINNLLHNFSWRPIFLDPSCQSDILNLMHITSSNLSIDTVERTVFLKIIKQVKKLKEEEESKIEWISKMKKKYNAHRGTYSKAPDANLANDGDPSPDSCHSQSSESCSDEEAQMTAKKNYASCHSSPKAKFPEPAKATGLPAHLLIKSIPYWKPQEARVRNDSNDYSSDEGYDQEIERKGKKKKESIQSIITCNKNSAKNSTVGPRMSSDVSKSVANANDNHLKRSKNGSLTKPPALSTCSLSYPIGEDDIMGPMVQYSPKGMLCDTRDDDINDKSKYKPQNSVAKWLLKEKAFDNDCRNSNTSLSPSYSSPSLKSKTLSFAMQSNIFDDTVQPNDVMQYRQLSCNVNSSVNFPNCNNSSSTTFLNKPCVLHPRERSHSFNQCSSMRK